MESIAERDATPLLDELDKRGHTFFWYAGEYNMNFQSKAAGKRGLRSVTEFVERKPTKSLDATEA